MTKLDRLMVLMEEIALLESKFQPTATGHLRTTVSVLRERVDELKAELKIELDNELPIDYIFISSVAQQGITQLKDKLWQMLNS